METRLREQLKKAELFIKACPDEELSYKPYLEKWSKKEILGHLIDSGINNLQRFTEIQFEEKPFIIQKYKQDELVKANKYQQADTMEILALWLAINNRIINILSHQTAETLAYKIDLGNGEISDLKFLMEDYVDHLAHHLNQIMKNQ